MNPKILQFIALAFTALVILQALLGVFLFIRLVGFSAHGVLAYYGDKSLHGLLEVALPHTLFISVALMAVLHFLAFIQNISQKSKKMFTHLLFALFFLDQFTPLFIAQGFEMFAYVKMGAFVGFEITLGWVWVIMFRESVLSSLSHHLNGQT